MKNKEINEIYNYVRFEYADDIANGNIHFDVDSENNMTISKWSVNGVDEPTVEFLRTKSIENEAATIAKIIKEKEDINNENLNLRKVKYDATLGKIVYRNGDKWDIVP